MTSRRLLALNVLLAAVAVAAIAYIVQQLATPVPMPAASPGPLTGPAAATAPLPNAPGPGPAAYSVVVARNLFSATRTEAPPTAAADGPPVAGLKPSLYGVVLREGAPIAYLEDPTTKRVASYRIGDSISGGTLETIAADHVVIARPDGKLDVRLRDPAKPRPAAPVPAAATGQPAPVPPVPGLVPPVQPPAATLDVPGRRPPYLPPGTYPGTLQGRPLPPTLLRRLPSPPASNESQQ